MVVYWYDMVYEQNINQVRTTELFCIVLTEDGLLGDQISAFSQGIICNTMHKLVIPKTQTFVGETLAGINLRKYAPMVKIRFGERSKLPYYHFSVHL